jgi:hypothetical protein
MERFLYRLSTSKQADRFILKGALLLRVWDAPAVRPTMDIDLLGKTSNDPSALARVIQEICRQSAAADGMQFDAGSVVAQSIAEEADYHGVRLWFRGSLGTAKVTIQIDVGFGDVVTPSPTLVDYPTLLGDPAPRLLAYPRESAVAEKFQVMLRRAQLNSRLRDYYDIWLLSRSFTFDGKLLASAIQKTCQRRGTEIPVEPVALTVVFLEDPAKQRQWAAYRRKSQLHDSPQSLGEIVQVVGAFLNPIARALGSGRQFAGTWQPTGPWANG